MRPENALKASIMGEAPAPAPAQPRRQKPRRKPFNFTAYFLKRIVFLAVSVIGMRMFMVSPVGQELMVQAQAKVLEIVTAEMQARAQAGKKVSP